MFESIRDDDELSSTDERTVFEVKRYEGRFGACIASDDNAILTCGEILVQSKRQRESGH